MLNQKRSGNLARLRYLVAIPVCMASLCASTLAFSKTYGWIDIAPAKPITENPTAAKTEEITNLPSYTQQPTKFPPPSVYKKGYGRLMGHLQQKITWTKELKNEKNSYVGVSFNVGADKKISNIQVDRPAGNGFDAVAKAAFESFDGIVTAPAGKHTFMVNYFSDKGPVDRNVLNNTAYDVKLVIVRPKPGEVKVKFPPPVVEKTKRSAVHVDDKDGGYVAKGRLHNGAVPIQTLGPKNTKVLLIVDGKKHEFTPESLARYNAKSLIYLSCDEMKVYEQGNAYAEKTWGKYGKVAVLTGNASIRIEEFPFGEDKKSTPAIQPVEPKPIDQSKLLTREFVQYLQENIKFPKYPLDNNFVVTLDVNFTVVNNNITAIDLTRAEDKLAYVKRPNVKISDEILNTFRAEVLKAIRTAPIDNIAPGKYQLPVAFLYKKGKDLFEVVGFMMTKTNQGTLAGVYPIVVKPV
ncbi:hypothetical protein [Mucilaginibacter antarcticus]